MNVLVADDEPGFRRVVRRVADKLGHSAIECENGGQLIGALEDGAEAGLIILDLQMPEMDGIQTIRTLSQRTVTTPIYLVTGGLAVNADAARIIAARRGVQIVDVLTKPVECSGLERILDRHRA